MTPTLMDKLEAISVPADQYTSGRERYTYAKFGGRYVESRWNHLYVICTFDPDGHCEISFSIPPGKKPNDGPINKFFTWWGARPLDETPNVKGCRHFVMRYGRTH